MTFSFSQLRNPSFLKCLSLIIYCWGLFYLSSQVPILLRDVFLQNRTPPVTTLFLTLRPALLLLPVPWVYILVRRRGTLSGDGAALYSASIVLAIIIIGLFVAVGSFIAPMTSTLTDVGDG